MLPGTDAPFVAPKPFSRRDLTDGQTRTQGQHAWRERLTRRGAGPPGARGGRGGGISSLRGGARSPAPVRRPSPVGAVGMREAGSAGANLSWEGRRGY